MLHNICLLILCTASPSKSAAEEAFVPTTKFAVIQEGLSLQRSSVFMRLGLPGGFMMALDASAFDVRSALIKKS